MTSVSAMRLWMMSPPSHSECLNPRSCDCPIAATDVHIAGVVYDLGADGLRAEVHAVEALGHLYPLDADFRWQCEMALMSEYERLNPLPFVRAEVAHV
jgi:hypothetical protein